MKSIKLALRTLLHNKTLAIINIAGLSVAFTVSVLILLFVNHHYSFDKNVKHSDRSYRIITGLNEGSIWACTFATFDKVLHENPAVERSTVFYKNDEEFDVVAEKKTFRISNPVYADTGFISYFQIPVKEGNTADLALPNTVLINELTAEALFGSADAIGKTIDITYLNGRTTENRTATIVGILDKNSQNSHLQYDLIHSKKGFYEQAISRLEQSKVYGAYAYLTLVPGVSATEFERQLPEMVTPLLKDAHGPPVEAFSMQLQPLGDIHFNPELIRDISPAVKQSQLNTLLIVGILLFITVVLNFLITNIARSQFREKRTQILHFLGSGRLSQIKSLLSEVLLLVTPAVVITLSVIQLFKSEIGHHYFDGWVPHTFTATFWIFLLLLALLVILVSIFTTSGRPVRQRKNGANKKVIPLIVFQFIVVIGIAGFGMLLNKQINFIHTKDLGYSPENVMIFRAPVGTTTNIRVFKEKAKSVSGILAVGSAMHYPGFRLQDTNLGTSEDNYSVKFAMINPDALPVLGIKTIDTFNVSTGTNFFINRTLYNKLAKSYTQDEIEAGSFKKDEEPNESKVPFHINGIINDINYESLYNPVGNFAFFVNSDEATNYRFLLVRYNQKNTATVASQLKSISKSVYHTSIDPVFLDKELNAAYQSEEQLLSVSKLFIVLTIIIAIMGLFAFSLYSIQQRTKEIGIRKVNGAKITEVMILLNKKYIKWISIAFIIAIPILWFIMHKWLESFAYKTDLSWWIFALSGLLALGIALLTVSFQSWKAATRNPVDSLRYE
ncbi:ABC transporter permease [Saccharicrinis sp. FJH2]|uniref:ABC transporter permease n=1 Tax=Saccharicrinis sp. FJH65 TaxID=3344659 RepID=UPI0035F3E916